MQPYQVYYVTNTEDGPLSHPLPTDMEKAIKIKADYYTVFERQTNGEIQAIADFKDLVDANRICDKLNAVPNDPTCTLETHFIVATFIEERAFMEGENKWKDLRETQGIAACWEAAARLTLEFESQTYGWQWGGNNYPEWEDTLYTFLHLKTEDKEVYFEDFLQDARMDAYIEDARRWMLKTFPSLWSSNDATLHKLAEEMAVRMENKKTIDMESIFTGMIAEFVSTWNIVTGQD